MNSIPLHSEPDAVVRLIGDVHMENGRLIVGDVDVAEKFAAALGVLQGGSQLMCVEVIGTKITTQVTTSSQGFSGKFTETSEPVPGPTTPVVMPGKG
jgi:hypothetical protein